MNVSFTIDIAQILTGLATVIPVLWGIYISYQKNKEDRRAVAEAQTHAIAGVQAVEVQKQAMESK
jgi:predicted histidine transporter YuiF (NhaC family)